ncbi:unnamed protein product [Caenorhabditis angaria]|uniref:SLC41A/MgtE integral membrane domain-containing protein n=1 Tax=Caenorhabditis angaria TaxID=860376 RepID=A0A9P1ISM2_9PELO|nr:unnamed protein product [Caenorhabditis angaria]
MIKCELGFILINSSKRALTFEFKNHTKAQNINTLIQAHIGEFDRPGIRGKVLRNIAVTEAQSVYVCLIANFVSFLIVLIRLDDTFDIPTNETSIHETTPHIYLHNFLFLGSSSIIAVAINCGISTIMLALVVNYTWKNNLNPDNIVTPLGASIGDLLTISGVVVICYLLRPLCEFSDWFPVVLLTISVLFIPVWLILAKKDKLAMKTAKQQCATLILSTSISCLAGLIQSKGAVVYPNYPAYQTLISGLTGNRCAVQASRISSHLEVRKESELSWNERLSPYSYYTSQANECKTARLLLFTSLPFQLFFMTLSYTISFMIGTPVEDSPWFFLGYSIAVLIQVAIIMFITQLIVFGLWYFGLDPDIHAIPMMTAAADVCGCGFLYLLFIILDSTCGCVFVVK